ncbi:MAG TPA: hypothetical protein VMG12_42435 [Polyangiaceae bacterium]|nr:hypothetical protein [Polyangiaceae bacterium]
MQAPPADVSPAPPDDSGALIPPSDILGQRVLELLERACQSCHDGSQRDAFAGATDIAALLESGRIVPGSSAQSPVYQAFMSGHERNRSLSYTAGDVELVRRFIDSLPAVTPRPCSPAPFVSIDDVFDAVAQDIASLPLESQRFARYVSLAYASNAGLCDAALERHRLALFEAVNATSLAPDITLPLAIDAQQLVYRIDLRDYRWDRAIDRYEDGSANYADAWLAAVDAAGAGAVEWQGATANAIEAAAQTAVPVLPANVLLNAIASRSLYSLLVGVQRDTEADRAARGVSLTDGGAADGGTSPKWAGILRTSAGDEAIVIRAEQSQMRGAYWWIEDSMRVDAETLIDDPFELNGSPRQLLFALPNGMSAFAIESRGQRQIEASNHALRNGDGARPSSVAACSSCHTQGLLPVRDEVRAFFMANPEEQRNLSSDRVEMMQTLYATPEDFAALMAADDERQRAALDRVGVPTTEPDPLSRVALQFDLERLTLQRAAADLGVPVADLAEALPELDPTLAPLANGATIDRAAFTAALPGARCALMQGETRPVGCP